MKKILALLLALLLVWGLCACSVDTAIEILEDINEIAEELPEPEEPETPPLPVLPEPPAPPAPPAPPTPPVSPEEPTVTEDGHYDSRDEVALYIHLYGHLPSNYVTKKQAEKDGWQGGTLKDGQCIGGDRFGNYEELLPEKDGRFYTECDIDTVGEKSRGAKRLVFSNDGLIYYTDDHYKTFTLLYGEE